MTRPLPLAPWLLALLLASGCEACAPAPEPAQLVLHLHRADGDYSGVHLEAALDGGAPLTVAAEGADAFGAIFPVIVGEASRLSFTVQSAEGVDVAGDLELPATPELWVFSGHEVVYDHPPALPGPDQVAIHYWRPDGDYTGWGLHLWGEDVAEQVTWAAPKAFDGVDPVYGAQVLVDLKGAKEVVNLIVHKGDTKDPGPDMQLRLSQKGNLVFLRSGSSQVFPHPVQSLPFTIEDAAAHWIDRETLVVPADLIDLTFELRHDVAGGIRVIDDALTGGTVIPLTPVEGGLSAEQKARFPHLAGHQALGLPAVASAEAARLVRDQLVVAARDPEGRETFATQVQLPGVLDTLFAYEGPLGVAFGPDGRATFRLWAPTARTVRLHVFDALTRSETAVLELVPGELGVWSLEEPAGAGWYGAFYQYEVEVFVPTLGEVAKNLVTDPYSVSLSTGSRMSQIVDLDDPALAPPGWETLTKPPLAGPADVSVYEVHLRDFSASDPTVPAEHRGGFLAFTYDGSSPERPLSDGMAHLRALAEAGLSHVQLLPIFDIATIQEDPGGRVELDDPVARLCERAPSVPAAFCEAHAGRTIRQALADLDPTTGEAQAIMASLGGLDGFNWGYDPFHYTVPEGSYATDPDGSARILELRRMVQALSASGLRVVMDVVYNHTNAAGQGPTSVLDRIVPGYYHRLSVEGGTVETSTCCANTASEHFMMERLMTDSLLTWARAYRIDGFRFDLMGHHMKAGMIRVRDALAALTLEADGVDGASIYLYGEGWNFGEVASNARGVNASQANMAGTGIGTFNDRLRDAARGGGPFDSGEDLRVNQGFVNGLWYDPNERAAATEVERTRLEQYSDLIRLGLAGNLRDFSLVDAGGVVRTGGAIGYQGARAGYTESPVESVNYVSKHDNQTLFDINQYKLPAGTAMADRVRAQNLGVALTVLGQGVPFLHLGVDLLRSKSMERDSYDSGDWFNAVDFSAQRNNWNVGLPREDKDGANWPLILEILADASIQVRPEHLGAAAANLRELLALRASSPLFRLGSKEAVMRRLDFPDGPARTPGVIVMSITDGTCAGADLDPGLDGLVVVFNALPEAHGFALPGAAGLTLHPVLAASSDALVRTARFEEATSTFEVPARTTAVFVLPQGAAQGAGLPCNTRSP